MTDYSMQSEMTSLMARDESYRRGLEEGRIVGARRMQEKILHELMLLGTTTKNKELAEEMWFAIDHIKTLRTEI